MAANRLRQRPSASTGAFDDVKLSYRRLFISRQGSTPGRDRVKGRFTVLPSRHLRRLVSARLAFVCTSHHKLRGSRTLKTPCPHAGNRSDGLWYGNTQQRVGRGGGVGSGGRGMIKRVTVAEGDQWRLVGSWISATSRSRGVTAGLPLTGGEEHSEWLAPEADVFAEGWEEG